MDDALVARWRDGESAATTAVRNAVRTTAERVLSNPALRQAEGAGGRALVDDEERRRELTGAVAKEVMARKPDSAATVTATALMVAARVAVEAIRVGRPLMETGHLSPPVAVSIALSPESLPTANREAAERHLAECHACSDDCRLVREVVRSASSMIRDAPRGDLNSAVQDSAGLESAAREAANATAPERRPSRPARRTASRESSPRTSGESGLRGLLPLLVIAGIAGIWWWSRHREEVHKQKIPELAALADRTAPDVGANEKIPVYANEAVRDLRDGDCRTAAARFRSARRTHPSERHMWLLEGASWVCAGEGAEALAALDPLARDAARPPGTDWYRAQALLLTGEVAAALDALDAVANGGTARAKQAQKQALDVRAHRS